jgi:hypothetical protein
MLTAAAPDPKASSIRLRLGRQAVIIERLSMNWSQRVGKTASQLISEDDEKSAESEMTERTAKTITLERRMLD